MPDNFFTFVLCAWTQWANEQAKKSNYSVPKNVMQQGGHCGWFHNLAAITHVPYPHHLNFPKPTQ
jgi:hypothetical protein